ncbi:MAG: four helix bundle protein [Melioribacteraceae bacterium]|nr:four helix bundle protein [Melioribacteraceae bacterium]
MSSKKFQDLLVWQKAHGFVPDICKLTEPTKKEELFG